MERRKKSENRKKVDRKVLNKKLMGYTLAAGAAMALAAPAAVDAVVWHSGTQNIPLDAGNPLVFIDMDDFSGSVSSAAPWNFVFVQSFPDVSFDFVGGGE